MHPPPRSVNSVNRGRHFCLVIIALHSCCFSQHFRPVFPCFVVFFPRLLRQMKVDRPVLLALNGLLVFRCLRFTVFSLRLSSLVALCLLPYFSENKISSAQIYVLEALKES